MSILGDVGAVQLGRRLAQLREQTGLEQDDLAVRIGWSQTLLAQVEAGERGLSDDELKILLKVIGTAEALELATVLERTWKHLPHPALDHPDRHLLWAAERLSATLEGLAAAVDVRAALHQRLKEYLDEIHRLAQHIIRRKHQIAFIGSIGIGKSTAICRATGLEMIGLGPLPVAVLATGGGGITLCEVQLSEGPGYGVIIEPCSHDEIREHVTDFVDQLVQDQSSVETDEAARGVPQEIERAIRNMAGLTRKKSRDADGKMTLSDPARTLAAEITSKRELVVEVLTLMGLERRDRRDEWYQPILAASPQEWMKSLFQKINYGRNPEISLPVRIDLVVPHVLGVADLDISIIDTRGDRPVDGASRS
jgi:transcriptional regulator with XRE-family HTH domain